MLNHDCKPGNTGRPSRLSVGLLSNAHQRSQTRDLNPGPSVLYANTQPLDL